MAWEGDFTGVNTGMLLLIRRRDGDNFAYIKWRDSPWTAGDRLKEVIWCRWINELTL